MTTSRHPATEPERPGNAEDAPLALELVLEQSQEVQDNVEACAIDIGSVNEVVKQRIDAGQTRLAAQTALLDNEKVEGRVQQCADDLDEVNDALARGIDDLKQTEQALRESRQALRTAEAALAASQHDETAARLRALHDATTGLPNRQLFDERLAHAISIAERRGWTLAVMFLDLDRFKAVNDEHGHAAGDTVLKEVARRLARRARNEDTVCRNGGDEFLYLLIDPQGKANIEQVAGAVARNIAEPIDVGTLRIAVGSSIGIAVYPQHGRCSATLIGNADAAMYCAKNQKSGFVVCDDDRGSTPGDVDARSAAAA